MQNLLNRLIFSNLVPFTSNNFQLTDEASELSISSLPVRFFRHCRAKRTAPSPAGSCCWQLLRLAQIRRRWRRWWRCWITNDLKAGQGCKQNCEQYAHGCKRCGTLWDDQWSETYFKQLPGDCHKIVNVWNVESPEHVTEAGLLVEDQISTVCLAKPFPHEKSRGLPGQSRYSVLCGMFYGSIWYGVLTLRHKVFVRFHCSFLNQSKRYNFKVRSGNAMNFAISSAAEIFKWRTSTSITNITSISTIVRVVRAPG